jgi:hypothetical protein
MNLEQSGFSLLLLAVVLFQLPAPATQALAARLDRDVLSHCTLQLFTAARRR